MLRSRVIPCLLIHNKGLVKTVQFKNPKYLGDPLNAVKIFNEKAVDEIMVLDIDASKNDQEPDYGLIEKIAGECRMPLCYGGGINSVDMAEKIIQLGVEKVALSSAVLSDMDLIPKLSEHIGRQSVVVVLDIKKNILGKYEIFTNNGTKKFPLSFNDVLQKLNDLGIGELVINSISNDGMMKGCDFKLAQKVRSSVSCPITLLGGVGCKEDIVALVKRFRVIGVAVGSMFVFKGPYKAVLISYLDKSTRDMIGNISNHEE
jgi:imidazole glycerol-phosphate synthase subunit HisF